jgi:hypothetical protein
VQNLTSPTIGLVTYADVFFAKYDALGNYVYVKKITGGTGLLYSYLDLDLSGNIYFQEDLVKQQTLTRDPELST